MNRLTLSPQLGIFIFLVLFFSSCKEAPPFEGYVEGTVVCQATTGNFGLVEFNTGHEKSFMAMYKIEDCDACKLQDKLFIKVEYCKGVPWAHSFKKTLNSNDQVFDGIPRTLLSYHCFYEGGNLDGAHKVGHINRPAVGQRNGEVFPITISGEVYQGDFRTAAIVNAILDERPSGSKIYFLDNKKELIDVNLCHYHAEIKVDCF